MSGRMSDTAILLFGMICRALPGSGSDGSTGTKENPWSISWTEQPQPPSQSSSLPLSNDGSTLASLVAGPIEWERPGGVSQWLAVSHPSGSSFTLCGICMERLCLRCITGLARGSLAQEPEIGRASRQTRQPTQFSVQLSSF